MQSKTYRQKNGYLQLSAAFFLIISMGACASKPTAVVSTESKAPPAAPSIAIVNHAPAAVPDHPVTATATATHHVGGGVAPDKALQWLKNGNVRFTKGYWRKDGASAKDIRRLTAGQKPHSIILSCSDSRVPPEVVFDQKLGEVFVIRTAGEALDPSSIASIEYAVEHLGSRNIVVMGHTQCGAVKAAFSTMDGKDAGSPNLNKLVADIHPRIKEFSGKPASEGYTAEVWANTKGVAQDLIKRSSILAEKVKSGDVKINSALYHLDAGTVDFAN